MHNYGIVGQFKNKLVITNTIANCHYIAEIRCNGSRLLLQLFCVLKLNEN